MQPEQRCQATNRCNFRSQIAANHVGVDHRLFNNAGCSAAINRESANQHGRPVVHDGRQESRQEASPQRRDPKSFSLVEYLADIGGRIGPDQQNPLTLFGKADSRRAGNGSFSYASLASKKTGKAGYSVRISYVLLTYQLQEVLPPQQPVGANPTFSKGIPNQLAAFGYRPAITVSPSSNSSGSPSAPEASRNAFAFSF